MHRADARKELTMKKMLFALAHPFARRFVPFEGETNKWKQDAAGNLVKDAEGNPILIKKDNTEQSVKVDTIPTLNFEAQNLRTERDDANKKLKTFEGIDPVVAKKAIETTKNIDLSKLVGLDKVEEVRTEVTKAFEGQMAEKDAKIADLSGRYTGTLLTTAFQGSTFIKDKLALPADITRDTFGKFFTVGEDGTISAKGSDGNAVYSKTNPGKVASFDEAIEILVGQHPHRDAILKGTNHQGTGNKGGGGNGTPGVITLTRDAFHALPPAQQAAHAAGVKAQTHAIVDNP